MTTDLVSIVVPIYKVEDYLEECVDSLIHQTYTNIEIILVDDGSPDNCGKIVDEYAVKDRRVTAVHKPNGGLSSARNEGMKYAVGDYIAFIDSDDAVDENFIERLLLILRENNADIAACDFDKFSGKQYQRAEAKKTKNGIVVFSGTEAVHEMYKSDSIGWSAWNKLYKFSLFEELRYPEGVICEDKATTYKLFLKSERVAYTREPLYHYRIRKDSISGIHSVKFCMDSLDINLQMERDFEHNHQEGLVRLAKAYSAKCAFMLYASSYRHAEYRNACDRCIDELSRKYSYLRYADYIPLPLRWIIAVAGKSIGKQKRTGFLNIASDIVNYLKRGKEN